MTTTRSFSITAFITVAILGLTGFIRTNFLNNAGSENKGFAVIELFTSEGCSSCPPADQLVAKIQRENNDKLVYILAYHVDYWDHLGWKDAFSNAGYSKRQSEYAHYLHLQSIYTPQIVVNGKTEFVGSEEGTLRNAIKTNLQKTAPAQLSLVISNVSSDRAGIKYNAAGTDKSTILLLAVLQKNAQTKVERGENSGRTLSHVQIVRKLQKVSLKGNEGSVELALPQGFEKQGWEIIGFLQNTANGAITGAAKAAL
jgi:hypothetical protein